MWGAQDFGYGAGEIIVMGRVREYVDGSRLLRMRLGELGWNWVGDWRLFSCCTRWCGIALLGLGGWPPPLVYMVWVGAAPPLVRLVSVELRSWSWGLASLPSLHSLAWDCALGAGGLGGWPPPLGLGSGLAAVCISGLSA